MQLVTRKSQCKKNGENGSIPVQENKPEDEGGECTLEYCMIAKPQQDGITAYELLIKKKGTRKE